MADKLTKKEEAAEKKKILKDVFAELDSINTDGAILSESALSVVDYWIDTGSYALNAICSGSMFKGIQGGRICGIIGPSGAGKTLISLKILGNFQKQDPDRWGIVFDSEIAVDEQTATSLGANPKQIKHYPVNTVKECRNQILKALDGIIANNLQGKFMIIVDSLGNLAGDKEVKDAEDGKFASDMGTRAKDIKSLLRVLTYRAAKAKTTIIFTNHIYSDPMAMFESLVKTQSGGEGPIYMASLLIQLGFKRQKNEKDFAEEEVLNIGEKNYGGILMHALTAKNRFIPGLLSTDLYLNFRTGLSKYTGLWDIATSLGVITGQKSYECNGQKIGFRKDIEKDPEIWDKIILPVLEKEINEKFSFSNESLASKVLLEAAKTPVYNDEEKE